MSAHHSTYWNGDGYVFKKKYIGATLAWAF